MQPIAVVIRMSGAVLVNAVQYHIAGCSGKRYSLSYRFLVYPGKWNTDNEENVNNVSVQNFAPLP